MKTFKEDSDNYSHKQVLRSKNHPRYNAASVNQVTAVDYHEMSEQQKFNNWKIDQHQKERSVSAARRSVHEVEHITAHMKSSTGVSRRRGSNIAAEADQVPHHHHYV